MRQIQKNFNESYILNSVYILAFKFYSFGSKMFYTLLIFNRFSLNNLTNCVNFALILHTKYLRMFSYTCHSLKG